MDRHEAEVVKLLIAFLAGGTAGAFLSAWAFELLFPDPRIKQWPRDDRIQWSRTPAT
jgi:hypothetical protein